MLQPHLTKLSLSVAETSKVFGAQSIDVAIRRAAFDLLAKREYPQQQLLVKLLQKFNKRPELAVTETQILDVVSLIADEGLQSDQRYFEMLIRVRMNQGYGPVRIAQELKQKGITQPDYDSLFNGADEAWRERAKQTKEKKFGKLCAIELKEKARQIRFLQYRGFTSEQIRYAMR